MKHVSDLLGSLLERKHIQTQVEAARVVDVTNTWLESLLPVSRQDDVCALSFREGVIFIACTSSASAVFVVDHVQEGLDYICQKLPSAPVTELRTRLVSELKSHDF